MKVFNTIVSFSFIAHSKTNIDIISTKSTPSCDTVWSYVCMWRDGGRCRRHTRHEIGTRVFCDTCSTRRGAHPQHWLRCVRAHRHRPRRTRLGIAPVGRRLCLGAMFCQPEFMEHLCRHICGRLKLRTFQLGVQRV